jgi:hypothetical protein
LQFSKSGFLLASKDLLVFEVPNVSAVDPSKAVLSSNSLVTVHGSLFTQSSMISCHWADQYATRAIFISTMTIICKIHPSLLAGNVSLHISNDGSVKSAMASTVSILLPPSVLKVSPSSSSHLGGLAVTIFGNGFSGHASGLLCVFGDISTLANVVNNSVAVCVTVAHSVGRVLLSVGVDGSIDLSGHVSFDFTSSSVHFCDSVTPNVVSAHGPSSVTIFGRGFNSYSKCRISEMLIEPKMTNSTTVSCLLDVLSVGRYSLDVLNSDTSFVCEGIWIEVVPAAVVLSASGARLHGELAALVTVIGRGFVQTSALSCFIGRERSAVVEFLNASAVVCAVKKDLIVSGKILVGASNTETCDSNCSV